MSLIKTSVLALAKQGWGNSFDQIINHSPAATFRIKLVFFSICFAVAASQYSQLYHNVTTENCTLGI